MKLLHQYQISTISVSDCTILNSNRFKTIYDDSRDIEIRKRSLVVCSRLVSTPLDSTRIPIPMLGIRTRLLSVWLRYCATVNVRRRPGTEMETEIECGPNTDKTKYESERATEANATSTASRVPCAVCRVPSRRCSSGFQLHWVPMRGV